MPSATPLVSVITNSYNCGRYLRAHVASVREQSYPHLEHIVVDCGSKDDSLAVLKEVAHPRLRLLEVPFCGVAEGRRRGIALAEGELLAILDADDTASPGRLERQVALLRGDPRVVAVGGGIALVPAGGGRTRVWRYPAAHDALWAILLSGSSPIPHSTLTMRARAYREIGGYLPVFEKSEDFDLVARLGRHGRLAALPEVVARILVSRPDSHTFAHRPRGRDANYYAMLAVLLDAARQAGSSITPEQAEEWLDALGLTGVHSLQGFWAARVLANEARHPGRGAIVHVAKSVLRRIRAMTRRPELLLQATSPAATVAACEAFGRRSGARR